MIKIKDKCYQTNALICGYLEYLQRCLKFRDYILSLSLINFMLDIDCNVRVEKCMGKLFIILSNLF